jgi:hypothetical protein
MDVVDVYCVGGSGVMGWVSAWDYDRSQPDPLADSMAEIIQHMNVDHKDALVLLARQFATRCFNGSNHDNSRSAWFSGPLADLGCKMVLFFECMP